MIDSLAFVNQCELKRFTLIKSLIHAEVRKHIEEGSWIRYQVGYFTYHEHYHNIKI